MVLFDLSPLKAGGGCQLALNFLKIANDRKEIYEEYVFLKPNVGPLANVEAQFNQLKFITTPSDNPLRRIYFESVVLKKIYAEHNISTVYTFFGAGLPHPQNVFSIVSVAYPIICYEESPYWKYAANKIKFRQKLINWARIKRLRNAQLIVVETEVMMGRLCKVLGRRESDFVVIPPAPSDFIDDMIKPDKTPVSVPSFLFLSGVAPHKNLWRLPSLAAELAVYLSNFRFIITTGESSFWATLSEESKTIYLQHRSHFLFIGSINPAEISKAYDQADFLVSLSDLESFSNNYMEAWKAGVPLIVSDRDFSRHICQDSALYIEPHRPKDAALAISNYLRDGAAIRQKIKSGKQLLEQLPANEEKLLAISSLINRYKK